LEILWRSFGDPLEILWRSFGDPGRFWEILGDP